MLKVHDAEASNENTAGGSLLDQIVRDGARQMLAGALQSEVAAYVEAFADELGGQADARRRACRGRAGRRSRLSFESAVRGIGC